MSALQFTHNEFPTIGVEIELQLVDRDSLGLVPAIDAVLAEIPQDLAERVKPELMQSYLEINTGICRTVRDVADDLRGTLAALESITDRLGLKLFWAATHPFSRWEDQQITVNDRYFLLVDLMQDVARRLVTFGLHMHIGLDTGDKAIMVCDRMMRHLPLLLALSSNSPFWNGRLTGLHSSRSKVMEDLPTAGLPYQMRNWSEYVWLVNHLIETGFIHTIRELWWDIRPHNNFGTVEIRVCDVPANLDQVLALTALVQCLVHAISEEIDEGTYFAEYHPMMVRQNKWRAVRYGGEARLVDSDTFEQHSVQETADRLIEILRPTAEKLDCAEELESVSQLPSTTGASQQLAFFNANPDHLLQERLREVVHGMTTTNDWRVPPGQRAPK